MKLSESVKAIAPALLKVQKSMEGVTKDAKNPYYKSNYADINSFLEVAIPALNANGIIVLQPTHSTEAGHFVETILLHESGEHISSGTVRLELDKADMQKLGSAITYARRYQLQALLGMRAEDDDGEATMTRTKTTAASKATSKAVNVLPAAAPTISITATTPAVEAIQKPKAGFAAFKKQEETKKSNGLF